MPGLKVTVVPVTPLQQNCTLITDTETNDTVVVDPGGDAPKIASALQAQGTRPLAIWLTHGHLDHAGGAMALQRILQENGAEKLEIIGPDARDGFLLESIEEQARLFGLPGMQNARADRFLQEGDVLTLGAYRFDVLHCPGHTPGHVVFVEKKARFAQLGDVLFRASVGRTDFPYGNHAALIDAIKTKILPLGDDLRFVCGHGPSSDIGTERATNPYIQ